MTPSFTGLAAAAALALAASAAAAGPEVPPLPTATAYACPDGREVVVLAHPAGVVLLLAGERAALVPAVSASGARFEAADGSGTAFWSKGREALVTLRGEALGTCTAGAEVPLVPASAADLAGTAWRVAGIGPGALPEGTEATMDFGADGALTGQGGCNRYRGRWQAEGETFAVGAVAATRMACAPSAMTVEQGLFDALEATRGAVLDPAGALLLLDAGGAILVEAEPA